MSDNDENKTGEVRKQFCPDNFIKQLEAAGYVRLDSFRWIKPEDIPLMAAKRKIKRARARRAVLETLIAEARMQKDT